MPRNRIVRHLMFVWLLASAGTGWTIDDPPATIQPTSTFAAGGNKPVNDSNTIVFDVDKPTGPDQFLCSKALGDFQAEYEGTSWTQEFDPDEDYGMSWPVTEPGDDRLRLTIRDDGVDRRKWFECASP